MLFNKDRAVEYMRRCEVDVLVATSPVNITYFSGYFCWLEPLFREYMMAPGRSSNLDQTGPYAIFPLEGEPALVVTPLFAVNAADLWVKDLHTFGAGLLDESVPPTALSDVDRRFLELVHKKQQNATPTDAVLSILKARGLTDARIGLDMEGLAPTSKVAIERGLPRATIKDCSNLIRLIRMVKTEDELSKLTRAAEISERAAMESLGTARPGHPISELVQHYRAQVARDGADFDHFAFGVRGLGIATESKYVLTDDDLLYVDFGCIYEYCFSDSGTTLAMREPSALLLEKHAALRACTRAGVEVIKPGVKASEVHAAMWQTLNAHGVTASFPHGHGLGLEVRDYPIIVANNGQSIRDDCVDEPSDLPLEADMVLNLEAMIAIPGVGSLHIEQSFAVTADGSRPLIPQDRARPILPSTG
jgi:Xaa-Pro aminopeptidase